MLSHISLNKTTRDIGLILDPMIMEWIPKMLSLYVYVPSYISGHEGEGVLCTAPSIIQFHPCAALIITED
jgi:hypothetical protein